MQNCITLSLSLAGRSLKGAACIGIEDQIVTYSNAQNMPCVYLEMNVIQVNPKLGL